MRVVQLLVTGLAILTNACVHKVERRIIDPTHGSVPGVEPGDRPEYLKAHMRDGDLFVLTDWDVDDSERRIAGAGTRYDPNREVIASGTLGLSIDSVALFESNAVRLSSSIIPLTVMSIASAGLTVYCIANPKACFGSCPTFYQPDDPDRILAEGFSASIAPSLEETDLDALPTVEGKDGIVRLVMRNEALETHVVRRADLLAVRRPAGTRVYALADGSFAHGTPAVSPTLCRAADGDCREALAARDGVERWSEADSTDLAVREWIELEFAREALPPGAALGLEIVSRQSLLPTYMLYQGLAFMGTRATEWLAAFERAPRVTRDRTIDLTARMGRLEIQVRNAQGTWQTVGSLLETGPLATDERVVRIPDSGTGSIRVRLELTPGMWRIDHAGLVSLGEAATPIRLLPSRVLRAGESDPASLRRLRSRDAQLTTLPGDALTLEYRLPDPESEYELFLESRGYYLEWMRAEWLVEENPMRAAELFLDPSTALKRMAPEYKRVEAEMERIFWSSRYEPAS